MPAVPCCQQRRRQRRAPPPRRQRPAPPPRSRRQQQHRQRQTLCSASPHCVGQPSRRTRGTRRRAASWLPVRGAARRCTALGSWQRAPPTLPAARPTASARPLPPTATASRTPRPAGQSSRCPSLGSSRSSVRAAAKRGGAARWAAAPWAAQAPRQAASTSHYPCSSRPLAVAPAAPHVPGRWVASSEQLTNRRPASRQLRGRVQRRRWWGTMWRVDPARWPLAKRCLRCSQRPLSPRR